MARKDDEDALTAAQKRAMRTGRSFFPAANTYRGININAAPGNVNLPTGGGGNSQWSGPYQVTSSDVPGKGVLPPNQNPAYQAAIAKGRPNRADLTWIQTPSGGFMNVPRSQVDKTLALFPGRPAIGAAGGAPAVGSERAASIYDPNYATDVTHVQNQLNFPRLYGQGYGNVPQVPSPLTAKERVQRGQSGVGEIASVAAHNIFGVPQNQGLGSAYLGWGARNLVGAARGVGKLAAGIFRPPTQVAQQYPNYYDYNPSPAPPPARRYSDLGYY